MTFMDCHSIELLDHDTFKTSSLTSLCALLKRDTFYAPEIDIFKAIWNWSTNNPDDDIKEALSTVRWSTLDMIDYVNVVEPSKILNPAQLALIMSGSCGSSNTTGRIKCSPQDFKKEVEENIATTEYGAKTVAGENPASLLSGNFTDYDVNKGCTYHAIDENNWKLYQDENMSKPISKSIIVDLGKVSFIDTIIFLLMDKDSRSYSYYIDVSLDGEDYKRLFDHTNNYYRSWQHLYFQTRPVRFIKLVGTRAINILQEENAFRYFVREWEMASYKPFCVVGFQAMHKTTFPGGFPEFIDGFMKPRNNFAKTEFGTTILQGVGANNMLNANPDEFTCHEIGSYILLQFNQPLYIDSFRMLLGNNMNRLNKYSFYIETSLDKKNWKMAVDKRNESLSGWQEFDFESRPANFIKITGTQNDVNFICTYFECPSNPEKPKLISSLKRE
ncbi:BTB/POZ domain-containing protein 9-like [Sitodiplosis mosellana]|uniref:BTB/POZ domain-containing protein 9-like n=1 Tax=Sitodiplosis mosellana TaxID=263140 RepID=UPI002444ACDA|nr:BTB/POZ domain-containing protein 9-like [Sitodiplosis mosellana]